MTIHKKFAFNDHLAHLASSGWLHDPCAAPRHDCTCAPYAEGLAAGLHQT